MITAKQFTELALSFEEAIEQPHFEKTSFRIRKKIFATLDLVKHQAVIKLSEIDQSIFCQIDPTIIYAVSGGWGKQGWTILELDRIPRKLMLDVVSKSYCLIAPKKLVDKIEKRE